MCLPSATRTDKEEVVHLHHEPHVDDGLPEEDHRGENGIVNGKKVGRHGDAQIMFKGQLGGVQCLRFCEQTKVVSSVSSHIDRSSNRSIRVTVRPSQRPTVESLLQCIDAMHQVIEYRQVIGVG